MQPKWIHTRPPNMADKNEAAYVADVQRRHGKSVEVGIQTGKSIHRHRKILPPSKRAAKKVENLLAMLCNQELPDSAMHMVTISLNKLHDQPPVLPDNATEKQRQEYQQLPEMKAMLIANLFAIKTAHEAGDARQAAYAYGAACNIIGHLEAMYDMPEIAEGLAVPERRKHGGYATQEKFAEIRVKRSKQYQPEINRLVLEQGLSFDAACHRLAENLGQEYSGHTLKKYVIDPRKTSQKHPAK